MTKLILAALAAFTFVAAGQASAQPRTVDLMSQYYIGH